MPDQSTDLVLECAIIYTNMAASGEGNGYFFIVGRYSRSKSIGILRKLKCVVFLIGTLRIISSRNN
jgi:hypothetical protein